MEMGKIRQVVISRLIGWGTGAGGYIFTIVNAVFQKGQHLFSAAHAGSTLITVF